MVVRWSQEPGLNATVGEMDRLSNEHLHSAREAGALPFLSFFCSNKGNMPHAWGWELSAMWQWDCECLSYQGDIGFFCLLQFHSLPLPLAELGVFNVAQLLSEGEVISLKMQTAAY